MAFKKVTVEFLIDDEFMRELVEKSLDNPETENVTMINAFRDELQEILYDEGGMSGSFMVINVEDVETPK